MGIFDWVFNKIASEIGSRLVIEDNRKIIEARSYRLGYQPRQLRVHPQQFDDNIALNLTGLVTSRIVSGVLGEGVEFRIDGDGNEAAQAWLDMCWDANHKEILLHKGVMYASEAGTGYIQIIQDGTFGEDGKPYPRLLLVDPAFVTIDTLPEDYEVVVRYTIQYKFTGVDGKERVRKRVIEHDPETERWVIVDYESATNGRFIEVGRYDWPYSWCPMIHWQSRPSTGSPYGEPDIDDNLIAMQNRINFLASNISKIVRLYAHPQTIAQNVTFSYMKDPDTGKDTPVVDVGPDKMVRVSGNDQSSRVYNLEQLNDLSSSLSFYKTVRQTLFDVARVVDIDSFQDKLGALTNFGLRVLYQDQIAMTGIKRELLGDALEEINRRVLEMGNFGDAVKTEVIWPETLPVNMIEQAQYYQMLDGLGVVDKQTIAEDLGLNWEIVSERLGEQKQSEDTLGSFLLRNFNRGQPQE